MDPEVAWAEVNNLSFDLAARADAAIALLGWLAIGGFTPGDSGAAVVAQMCQAIIIGYIESLES